MTGESATLRWPTASFLAIIIVAVATCGISAAIYLYPPIDSPPLKEVARSDIPISKTTIHSVVNSDRSSTLYSYLNPPPLPVSEPTVAISIGNVTQLVEAISRLQTGQTIRLAAGTYDLAGLGDALYVPEGISDWTIRGATGKRSDVV